MQQTYFCPNCRAQVAYGQTYCTRCNTVLHWTASQTPQQYQSTSTQYPNQQQSWDQQQQWNQQQPSKDDQSAAKDDDPRLWQRIYNYRGAGAKILVALVIIAVLIGVITALQGEIVKLFSKPVVATFDASSQTVTSGQSANLRWNVTGYSSVSITPGVGTVPSSGYKAVSPDATTTYTLVASNLFGSAQKSTSITVTGVLPSIGNFSSNTNSIYAGQSAILSWSVTGATSVSINPNIGTVSSTGTQSVSPSLTTEYILTASNSAGNSTASAKVAVAVSTVPIVTTFSANPASIKAGESSTLTWDVIGSTSININQGIGGVGSKGSMTITPVATTTYTLVAGGVTKSFTVTVDTTSVKSTANSTIPTSAPKISSFSASPNVITLGDNATLTWAVVGAKTISISPSVGTVQSSGSMLIIPIATTTYTLSAVNNLGTDNVTAAVTVNRATDGIAPVIRSFTATPSSIPAGGTTTLTWDIRGATAIIIDQGIGTPASYYSQPVSPAATTSYTLTAINSFGTATATSAVTVGP